MKNTIILVFALIALTGCIAPVQEMDVDSRLSVGFSQVGAESAWRTCNSKDIQRAAKDADILLTFYEAEQKQTNQIRDMRSLIAYQVDVIAFAPIVSSGWDNVLQEAKAAGIPVIVADRKIDADQSLYAGFLGTNSEYEGRKAGEFLLKKMAGKPGEIRIAELEGTKGSSPAKGRGEGFRKVISKFSRYKIVYSESGDFLRSKGEEIMRNIIQQKIEIDVLYSHNDAMTLGAIDVMEQAGIVPGKDIIIITVDAEQEAIDKLIEGKINCIVECNPYQGNQLMQLASAAAKGRSIPRETYVKEVVFSEYDDLTNMEPRGY